MSPGGVLLLPLSVLALAGTTLSTVPASAPASSQSLPVTRSVATPSARALERAPTAIRGGNQVRTLRGRWTWPLQPQPAVLRPFLRPATTYGAGHRGVDLAGAPGQEVRAVEAGLVTHVGSIAGRGTVTVLHASGIRSTYEPLTPTVATGSSVVRGAPLGALEEVRSHCAPAVCLHLGAVRGEVYLDPMVLLMGRQRVRLLPLTTVRSP